MKTKTQIFKESICLIFIYFFVSGIYFSISKSLEPNQFINVLIGTIFTILISSFLMFKIFEKNENIKLSVLKYSLILFFSLIFSIAVLVLAITVFGEFLFDKLVEWVKSIFQNSLVNALMLFIPMIFVGLLFGVFGLVGIMTVSFIIGNLIFSFIVEKFFSEKKDF